MAKTKISEFDVNPANNTDINNINIAEGCAPSGINNAIRQLMSDLKEQQTGASGDPFTVGGAFVASGTFAANGGATLGDASGDALTINSSAVSIPNGLNFDSNTLFIDATNNRVGVGTGAPAALLETNVASGNNEFRQSVGGTTRGQFISSATDQIIVNGGTGSQQFWTGGSERMRIDSSGNVGIGTNSPSEKLTVVNSGAVSSYIYNTASTADALTRYRNNTGNCYVGINATGGYLYTNESIPLLFYTATTERMRITSSGNVGIGTISPSSRFQVVGQSGFGGGAANSAATISTAATGNDAVTLELATGSSSPFSISLFAAGASPANAVYLNQRNNAPMVFQTNNSESFRLDSSGNLLLSNGNQYYGMNQYNNKRMMNFNYPPSGQFGGLTDTLEFATPGNGSSLIQMRITQGGSVGCRGSFSGGQTLNDYAEYFEWSDSNPSNEDRIGVTVVLDNGQIRPSTQSDASSSIIGVVSGTAGVVLGSAPFEWSGKYQRDEFGRVKTYAETWINWSDESGNHNYKQGEVPSDVVVPDTAEIRTYEKQLLSENYDESVEYANREHRPEWACIGLVGQVHVKKGQVVGDRWIKMKDISENVEMWFIR